MTPKDEHTLYDTLDALAPDTGVPEAEEDFSLEEILAEYGADREHRLLEDVERAVSAPPPAAEEVPEGPPEAPETVPEKAPEAPRETAEDVAERLRRELPRSPRPLTLEEMVGSTVDAVMETRREPLLRRRPGLFSRRVMEETEELPKPPEPEEEAEEEPLMEEEPLWDTAEDFRAEYHRRRAGLPAAAVASLIPTVLMVLERRGFVIPYWSDDTRIQTLALLGLLALVCLLCRGVFAEAAGKLGRKRCVSALPASLAALAAAGDCAVRLLSDQRTQTAPYAAVSCWVLVFALWGLSRESRGRFDAFRTAALDGEPPYLVTETDRGACKQRGAVPGFYTTAFRDGAAEVWQTAVLPVVLMATVVFAGLTSLGQNRGADFLLNWSALLCAGAGFALPLCFSLPYSKLARHLHAAGCAVAGWCGAEKISRRRSMILTDADLFPPGTIQLNGVKVFGEELDKVRSYAATMARAAGSGLERLFDGLVRSEGGRYYQADGFSFYEEGGWAASIRGESVLMGTASFMRKMDVRLPGNINLRTGVFLAADRQLIAVFAVKYNPAENVDFALRMMRRSRITPILASRDPNITPALLRRKFSKKVKVEYPDLTARVALSEAELDRGMPRALLFREGLLPYAETVAGSRRLCRAVRRALALSLLGSAAGTLLAFYLAGMRAYDLLTPLGLEAFLLLWTLPVLLMTDWTGRY